ncbi:HEAT repeat-containing protein 6 [Drosophila subobscura]|uniref:HEAT repeat-containing protein 6 n=1 Tax=Drosophila subobscura TaxID=7241 RepID=UPI00155AD9E7|nr:HEAT repeat-containing protein 6 [Drosophila subobscura]
MDGDREKQAHDGLLNILNALNTPGGCSKGLPLDEASLQEHRQLLHDIRRGAGEALVITAGRVQQLLAEADQRQDNDLLRAWHLWLNELILNRRLLLARPKLLVDWLLERAALKGVAEELQLLHTLLKSLPVQALQPFWPILSILSQPQDVEAALLLVMCQETVYVELGESDDPKLSQYLANNLLQPHYEGRWVSSQSEKLPLLLAHTLQLLQKIVSKNCDYAEQHVPELMGYILAYLPYGACGEYPAKLHVPRRVQPAQQGAAYATEEEDQHQPTSSQSKSSSGGKRSKVRKVRTRQKQKSGPSGEAGVHNMPQDRLLLLSNLDYGCLTGDTEAGTPSDSEAQLAKAGASKALRQLLASVRISALHLMSALTKQLPRRCLYGYWHAIFPSDEDSQTQHHLLHLAKYDGNSRCRALALQLAGQLLYGSKGYLSQAHSRGPSTFTPFSVSLARSVMTVYRSLTYILEREYAPPVLTQCLKCLAILVQATPFDQLEMGFVYEFVLPVKRLAKSGGNTPVTVAALMVMEMLVATPRLTQEMSSAVGLGPALRIEAQMDCLHVEQEEELEREREHFCEELCDSEAEEENDNEQEQQPKQEQVEAAQGLIEPSSIPRNSWLLRMVLRYLGCPSTEPPLRLECYQVLLAMTTHIGLLRKQLAHLGRAIAAGLMCANADVRLHAARCLDSMGYQMGRTQPEPSDRELELAFWLGLLPHIFKAFNAEAAPGPLKSALCDSLSNMGVVTFEDLPTGQRHSLVAFLSGCSSDDAEEPLVRAAALRALAVFAQHPSLKANLVFVENVAELTLRLTSDSQVAVRIKAAWALGNISDALLAGVSGNSERVYDELLDRLIQTATKCCSDHDKVRANAVRALGNLLQLQLQLLAGWQRPDVGQEKTQAQAAIIKLLDCMRTAGGAKVKWNACYAIGSLVKHREFFSGSAGLGDLLFPSLCQLIVQHANFKVRINATAVLLQVEQRADFDSHFALVWRSLLEALERSNALDSFEEYNHRDGLQQQLCLAIVHLLALALPNDLPACQADLGQRVDMVVPNWRRVAYRMIPEQSAPLFTCSQLLDQRLHSAAVMQRPALNFIVKTLRLDS